MAEKVIELGDVIVLKSGSAPMVVTALIEGSKPKPGYSKVDTLQACCWREDWEEVLKYVVVPSSCVRLYDPKADKEIQTGRDKGTSSS